MSYWYGLSFDDIAKMPIAAIEVYMDRLSARMAEMKLLFSDTAMMPHVKASDRRKAIGRWNREASFYLTATARPASPAVLRMMGIGIEHVH